MKRWIAILLPAMVVLAVLAVERASARRIGNRVVVIELFTSQGCSSCPPADDLLRRIARDPDLRGRVIPLAFHVDYWNSLGWRDPFSSREWSQRQSDYAQTMKLKGAYTPQIVVNGTREMVGSNSLAVYRAIEEESNRAAGGSVAIARTGRSATVRATTSRGDVDLIVVLFENGATTRITSGENEGKTLANDAIVRKLMRFDGTAERKIDADPRFGIAAFLQERAARRIVASSVSHK